MLRPVADSLSRALLDAFPADRPYPPEAYHGPPMPAPVAHWLDRALADRAEREVERLGTARTLWIDYDDPDVRASLVALEEVFARHVRVPPNEWERVLREAVGHVLRHLARPLDTLVDVVYEDADELPAGAVRHRMASFSAYGYLRDAVDLYVEQKEVDRLARRRFAALLERVAHQVTADYTPAQWLRLVEPLFAVLDAAPDVPEGHVPAALLLPLFEQHGHDRAADRLHDRLARDEQALLDREALRTLLAGDRAAEAPAEPEPAHPREQRTPEPSGGGERPKEAVPLWKQYRQGPAEPAPVPAETSETGEAVPLWQRFRARPGGGSSNAGGGRSDELAALERAVLDEAGRARRDRFVRGLFGGSTEAYRTALERLRGADDWAEASRIIGRDVFQRHRVNIYSEEAVAFTDAVEARFR